MTSTAAPAARLAVARRARTHHSRRDGGRGHGRRWSRLDRRARLLRRTGCVLRRGSRPAFAAAACHGPDVHGASSAPGRRARRRVRARERRREATRDASRQLGGGLDAPGPSVLPARTWLGVRSGRTTRWSSAPSRSAAGRPPDGRARRGARRLRRPGQRRQSGCSAWTRSRCTPAGAGSAPGIDGRRRRRGRRRAPAPADSAPALDAACRRPRASEVRLLASTDHLTDGRCIYLRS